MRKSMFGDYYVTSLEDDAGEAFMARGVEPSECFADICEDGEGGYCVEIRENASGDDVVQTDPGLFADPGAARKWAREWVTDVNDNF